MFCQMLFQFLSNNTGLCCDVGKPNTICEMKPLHRNTKLEQHEFVWLRCNFIHTILLAKLESEQHTTTSS